MIGIKNFLFLKVLEIRCISCARETRAPSLSKIVQKNVSAISHGYIHILVLGIFLFILVLDNVFDAKNLQVGCKVGEYLFISIAYWLCSHLIQKQKDPSKAHQMKLDVIVKALKWLEMDMDIDEVFILSLAS